MVNHQKRSQDAKRRRLERWIKNELAVDAALDHSFRDHERAETVMDAAGYDAVIAVLDAHPETAGQSPEWCLGDVLVTSRGDGVLQR